MSANLSDKGNIKLNAHMVSNFSKMVIDTIKYNQAMEEMLIDSQEEDGHPKLYYWTLCEDQVNSVPLETGIIISGSIESAEARLDAKFTPMYPEGFYLEVEEITSTYETKDDPAPVKGIYGMEDLLSILMGYEY